MKKLLLGLGLALLSCQAVAITTIAGIEFIDIATNLDASVGNYSNNVPGLGNTGPQPIADVNGASWVMSGDATATLDVSFGGSANGDNVDLTMLFVGDGGHSGTITLLGGSSNGTEIPFAIGSGAGYTGHNADDGTNLYGIFSTNLTLAGLGTFNGVQMDISAASAVPSLVGTTAVVPVPAAVWLFGSGLIALAGAARRRT